MRFSGINPGPVSPPSSRGVISVFAFAPQTPTIQRQGPCPVPSHFAMSQPCPWGSSESLSAFGGGQAPSDGGLGVSPRFPKTPLGRAGGTDHAHVAATTPTPPTRTRPRLDKASALPRGQSKTFSLRCCRGPTVNQAVADNLESGRSPQKNIFFKRSNNQDSPVPWLRDRKEARTSLKGRCGP